MRDLFRLWPFRSPAIGQRRILVIDDHLPDQSIGSGVPRAIEFLRALSAAGAEVVMWPVHDVLGGRFDHVVPHGAAVVYDQRGGLRRFLARKRKSFDCIIISRPHNMRMFLRVMNEFRKPAVSAMVVYDAEALFAEREIIMRKVLGAPLADHDARRQIEEEMKLSAEADIVLTVNAHTSEMFRAAGHRDVRILGYAVALRALPEPFDGRSGFLFVGPTRADGEPNSDAVVWFVDRVLPRLRSELGGGVSLTLVGMTGSCSVLARNGLGLDALGAMPDLAPVYSHARVFVAPIRFAAGIAIKVYDAAAHGIPTVITPILARGLGWTHDVETLVAETPDDFAVACLRLHGDRNLWERIRSAALSRVEKDCSVVQFDRTVADLVSGIATHRP